MRINNKYSNFQMLVCTDSNCTSSKFEKCSSSSSRIMNPLNNQILIVFLPVVKEPMYMGQEMSMIC